MSVSLSQRKRIGADTTDRYWGTSSPYENLTSETLQYLTLEQAIADMTHFAKTVDLPFDTNHSSNAQNAVSDILSYVGDAKSIAMGVLWRIVQRCAGCVDRVDFAGHVLGVPCVQRAC